MRPTVLNRYKLMRLQRDVLREYIGRPTIWGNPFQVGVHGTREECVQKYEEYLLSNPYLMERLPELRGKDLVCFCAPLPCHGDVLLKYANEVEEGAVPIQAITRQDILRQRNEQRAATGRIRNEGGRNLGGFDGPEAEDIPLFDHDGDITL